MMAESDEVEALLNRIEARTRAQRLRRSSHHRRDERESVSGSDESVSGVTFNSVQSNSRPQQHSDSCHQQQVKKKSSEQNPKREEDDHMMTTTQTDELLIPNEAIGPFQRGSKCNPEVRAKLRSLLLATAFQERQLDWEDPTEMASPRTFVFLTRPGRPWQYVIDAPAGHGASGPMALVPAVGIPQDTTHVAAKMRAIRNRKAKLKSAVAFIVQRNKVKEEAQDTFDESISALRSAIRVNMEMVSLSDDSDNTEDEIIPMFAPLKEGPDPVVEQNRVEASHFHSRRRERRRSSYEAITSARRTSRRVSQLMGDLRGPMIDAATTLEGGMAAFMEGTDRKTKFNRRLVGIKGMFKSYRKKADL